MLVRMAKEFLDDDVKKKILTTRLEEVIGRKFAEGEIIYVELEKDNATILPRSFSARLTSASESVKFMCEALKNTDKFKDDEWVKRKLNNIVCSTSEKYNKLLEDIHNKKNYKVYEQCLYDYLNHIVTLFLDKDIALNKNDILELLAEADNYTTLLKPKPIVATLSGTHINDQWVCLARISQPQAPLSEEMAQEYINAYYEVDPIRQPRWYREMSYVDKICFDQAMHQLAGERTKRGDYVNQENNITVKDILEKISAIPSKERKLPGVANFLKPKLVVMNEKFDIIYSNEMMLTSSFTASRDVKDQEMQLNSFAKPNVIHIIKTSIENKIAKKQIHDEETVRKYIDTLLNKHIIHKTLISPAPLSGLVIPDKKLHEAKIRAIDELKRDGFTLGIEYKNSEGVLTKLCYEVKAEKLKILPINCPMNKARHFMATHEKNPLDICKETAKNITELLNLRLDEDALESISKLLYCCPTVTEKELEEIMNKDDYNKDEVRGKIEEFYDREIRSKLIALLNYMPFFSDSQRELYLAANVEFVASLFFQIIFGGCLSGKDREGFDREEVDAMHLYMLFHKELPPLFSDTIDDTKINNFFNIFAHLFETGHEPTLAALNAPGANGQKTPNSYLGNLLLSYLRKKGMGDKLILTDQLANLNELDTFFKEYSRHVERFLTSYVGGFFRNSKPIGPVVKSSVSCPELFVLNQRTTTGPALHRSS